MILTHSQLERIRLSITDPGFIASPPELQDARIKLVWEVMQRGRATISEMEEIIKAAIEAELGKERSA